MIISDGWDTGDPEVLRREMERLSLVAYRIVWVNPRTKSARFQPLAGGMAAAWPHCDAVVSAHSLAALDDLADAVADPVRRRSAVRPGLSEPADPEPAADPAAPPSRARARPSRRPPGPTRRRPPRPDSADGRPGRCGICSGLRRLGQRSFFLRSLCLTELCRRTRRRR